MKFIDGNRPWGTDGGMPKEEYRSIRFSSAAGEFYFSRNSFRDLFEPNADFTTAYLDKTTKRIYIKAMNSDAAGSYEVVWVVEEGRLINREVFVTF